MGFNKRLHRIVHDSIFTNDLTLLRYSSNNSICSLPDPMLNRFCSQILPEMRHKIRWLNLELLSMERILLSTNYPNLFRLGIYNIEEKTALRLFTDETSLTHIFKNQISSLAIGLINEESQNEDVHTFIFTHIFTMFTNLQDLNFNPSFTGIQRISFRISPSTIFCSTLLVMHVNVSVFNDRLYLLDGRFNQLHRLYVKIPCSAPPALSEINNKQKLPNLRYFWLSCSLDIGYYGKGIIPFLHRMSNLEQLSLYFTAYGEKAFIDGNNLKENIINHMPRLNKFVFNILSFIDLENQIDLQSNEYIRRTFSDFRDNQIISCVDYFPDAKKGQCHVYSYPFTMKCYERITNNFSGGLFECVRVVSLFDECSFEHEFFLRISQSFPLMENLTLINNRPQNNKQYRKAKHDSQDLLIIEYRHLIELDLTGAHDDYVEQFLFDTKTHLPKNVYLFIDYQPLKRVTHNFTRNATRINCAKVNYSCANDIVRFSKHFKKYLSSCR